MAIIVVMFTVNVRLVPGGNPMEDGLNSMMPAFDSITIRIIYIMVRATVKIC